MSAANYDQGHIPGAVLWDAYKDLRHPDFTPIDAEELTELLGRSGVTADSNVVLYGYAPHLGHWLLDRHGHEGILVMDGGREAWEGAGGEWDTDPPRPGTGRIPGGGRQPRADRDSGGARQGDRGRVDRDP